MYGIKLTGNKELLAALNRLSSKGMKDTVKRTLNRVGYLLQNETSKNLKASINVRAKSVSGKKPMSKGITKKVWKNNEGITISILGDKRLKWFETGTKERKTKTKGRYKKIKATGKINAFYFFKKAVASKQQTLINDINRELSSAISKNYKIK